jgi:hypothetical protein
VHAQVGHEGQGKTRRQLSIPVQFSLAAAAGKHDHR